MAQRPDAPRSARTDGPQGNLLSSNGQPLPNTQAKKTNWTGFAKKTLWDWMQLLIIPFVFAVGTLWFNAQQANTSLEVGRQQHASDQQIATDQQEEATLNTYINDMSDLLINHNLRSSKPDDELRIVARAKTFIALQKLDGNRKGGIIQFLYEAQLIGYSYIDANGRAVIVNDTIINLYGVDSNQADLSQTYLERANLEGASLEGANFVDADLREANLRYAKIKQEQLSKAYSLENTLLPDGSQFPSKTWPIPGRDAKCVRWVDGNCMSQQEIERAPTPISPPPSP